MSVNKNWEVEFDERFLKSKPYSWGIERVVDANPKELESFISQVEKKAKQDTLAEVIERVEKLKRVVPKDPLDITPREAMANLGGNLVYRPYISNEEAINQTLQTLLASLRDKGV